MYKIEEEVLKKKTAYEKAIIPDTTSDAAAAQAQRMEELRMKALDKYRGFLASRPQERAEIARTYFYREKARQIIRALEGGDDPTKRWERALPYGVCSAALLREAEEAHKERKASMAWDLRIGGVSAPHTGTAVENATVTVAVETPLEAQEADQLLWGLEADLGYDFSENKAKEPLPKAKSSDQEVLQARFSGAGGYGRLVR